MPTLPLVAFVADVVLPGETHAFGAQLIGAALRTLEPGSDVCVLGVASMLELPSLVSGRWATRAKVVARDDAGATLTGERRVRIVSARGRDGAFTAEIEEIPASITESRQLLEGVQALLATLAQGATPDQVGWENRLPTAVGELVRALASEESRRKLLEKPLADALLELARHWNATSAAETSSRELEALLLASAAKAELPLAMKHRLWSQVVEIQKRLDVYDPNDSDQGDDLARLQRRLAQVGLPKAARETAKRELRLLRSMATNHHDYSTYVAHLDLMARLSWHPETVAPVDLASVRAALDREHDGLDKPKRRILEYLAVRQLGGTASSMVLCLAGPPGVGKTSLARVVAAALGRKFLRIPLGGVHDEAEIRGHRISFTAAAPGRIVGGFARVGTSSPVVLLDEIDKIGKDRQRSPAAALLEVLDPEQNSQFQDNYLGLPFDLSNALFIATANDLSEVNEVLLDRLEVIEIEGYTVAEKSSIVRRHMLPAMRAETGLPHVLEFEEPALTAVIETYTQEPGVRQLRRSLAAIHRARALDRAEGRASADVVPVSRDEVKRVLGPMRHIRKLAADALPIGVATGLSVGPAGGAILFVEVATMRGHGALKVTGRCGEVLRESVEAAVALVRADPQRLGIDPKRLRCDLHVHLPDAATPKDGPSAGIVIVAALVSALRRIPLAAHVAMTGEISLQGRVLPVGGIRAKVVAAERAGLRVVVIPSENASDVPDDAAVRVVTVDTIAEALEAIRDVQPVQASDRP